MAPADVPSMYRPQSFFQSLFVEKRSEVAMPWGGLCVLSAIPVPTLAVAQLLCRSGAAAPRSSPTSSSSYGKHPQTWEVASGQEQLLGQTVRSLAV